MALPALEEDARRRCSASGASPSSPGSTPRAALGFAERDVPRVQDLPARLQGRSTAPGSRSTSPRVPHQRHPRGPAAHRQGAHRRRARATSRRTSTQGSFDTVLWDPRKNTFKKIPTPDDFFCSGHAQLPDGRLLVAGGTARYETLDGEVDQAGGGMRVKNENPDKAVALKKGTVFRSPAGRRVRHAGST